jgi:hypothetical protein
VRGYDNQNQTNKAIYCLSHISPNSLLTCQENNIRTQQALEKLEPLIRQLKNNIGSHLQQSTHNQNDSNLTNGDKSNSRTVAAGAPSWAGETRTEQEVTS